MTATADGAADYAAMAEQLHDQSSVERTTELVVKLAVDLVGCTSAGVFLRHGRDRVESAAATDPLVERADQLQLECGRGPCLEALGDNEILVIPDTETDERFAPWSAQVAELGLRSVLSLPLFSADDTTGALNLYDESPEAFGRTAISRMAVFARHATLAVKAARNESSLRHAIDSRHLIGQAQGILMERFGLGTDQAFAVLLRYSQDKNLKLRHVAESIVSSRRLPG
ncbi:MAG TPA: GAF and ANTAR domain-containing protein [Dermatophilaceae bacterium]|nr:GAF and ANTAR domain-containing protein [Dermatophilaceae bacterium]